MQESEKGIFGNEGGDLPPEIEKTLRQLKKEKPKVFGEPDSKVPTIESEKGRKK